MPREIADFHQVSKLDYGLVESLRVNPRTGRVSWVDIEFGTLSTLSSGVKGGEERVNLLPHASFAESLPELGYVFAAGQHLGVRDETGNVSLSPTLLSPGRRFNDGAIDKLGRLVIGSMNFDNSDNKNVLLLVELDGAITVLDSDLGLSNGIVVAPETGALFSVDTLRRTVYRRDLDIETSVYGPRQVFAAFDPGENPDGIAYSATGHLVVALWGSAAVAILDASGREVQRVSVPPVFATSVCIRPDTGALLVGGASQPREKLTTATMTGGVWEAESWLEGYPVTTWSQPRNDYTMIKLGSQRVIV